jgi:hypothetical protein
MNLDVKPKDFRSFLKESLNIENFEYSYMIPILSQTAEYWGDAEMVFTCNVLSQQVKEYLNHTGFVLFYMYKTEQEIRMNGYLSENYTKNFNRIHKNKEMDLVNLDKLSFYDFSNINHKIQLENRLAICEKTKKIHLNSVIEKVREIDNNLWITLPTIKKLLARKKQLHHLSQNTNRVNFTFLDENHYVLLLKNLRNRKFWKATKWYPILSEIASREGMISLSQNFLQIAKSEQNTSKLLVKLIER